MFYWSNLDKTKHYRENITFYKSGNALTKTLIGFFLDLQRYVRCIKHIFPLHNIIHCSLCSVVFTFH